jgi:hypothetical protein
MGRSRTARGSARTAWVTRAEAAFIARVGVEEIDRWIAAGSLAHRRIGGVVLVDPTGPTDVDPGGPTAVHRPVEARSVRAARARPGRALPGTILVAAVAALATTALLIGEYLISPRNVRPLTTEAAGPPIVVPTATPGDGVPVGRDPFTSPFTADRSGEKTGEIVVKPPGVVRAGHRVVAAATVVNGSDGRWLPPSDVTFVARDGTGRVLASRTTTVSLAPGRSETVVAPDLGIDPAAIAAIEAHIDPARLRSGRYRPPNVSVATATTRENGKAIEGALVVGNGAGRAAALSCALFDSLDELVGVSTTEVDLSTSHARRGRVRFWMPAHPTRAGPYRVSCSAS